MPNTPTNGNDTFTFVTGDGGGTIDGLRGFDLIRIDHSAETNPQSGEYGDPNQYYGALSGYLNDPYGLDGVSFQNIEALSLKMGSGDDSFTIVGKATHATIDGGAGSDTFHGYFDDATAAISFALNPLSAAQAITGTATTIGHFEQVDISGGSAADTLTGSNGNDTFNGGGGGDSISGGGGDDYIGSLDGANTLNGGAGNDTLYSTGGADHVDGGADIDSWIGNFSTATTNLTLAAGASAGSYTLTGGTTLANIENVNLTTGSGNDTATIKGGGSFYGGDGFDTLNIDHTAETVDEQGTYDGVGDGHYSSYLGGGTLNGSPNALTFITDALNVKLGSGNDSFGVYGAAAHLTVDGGAGSDTFSADYSDATAAISFALNASGATQAIGGTGTTIGHFEQIAITGGTGSDTLVGGDGNDTLVAGLSIDSLSGGGGDDQLYIAGGTVNGGAGNDTIHSYYLASALSETIDGGTDNDGWYGHYDAATTALTFAQTATPGSFTLTGGVTLANIEYIRLDSGSGNDVFSFRTGVGAYVNGGDGFDTLKIDHSTQTTGEYGDCDGNSGYYYNIIQGGSDGIQGVNIEALSLKLGSGDDSYTIRGSATHATVNGGAGNDTFTGDFTDAAGAITLTLNPLSGAQAIGGTNTTIGLFEQVNLETGAGNDSLVGGAGNDTFGGGTGNDTLCGGGGDDVLAAGAPGTLSVLDGGAGNDQLASQQGGAEHVDGGADYDTWTGTFGDSTDNLVFAQGATPGSFTLTGGTTLANIESVNLTTGSGDDTFNLSVGTAANVDLGSGFDTANIDHSGEATNENGVFYASGYVYSATTYINLRNSPDTVDIYNAEALNLKLGTGDDSFQVDGASSNVTVDGGAGNDSFVGDFRDATTGISLTVNPAGLAPITGTGTSIGHFEQVEIYNGAGDDTLVGGAEADIFHSYGGADKIDGGGGSDTWYGDFSAYTDPLTFTEAPAGGGYTFTGGGSLDNIEALNLTTGSGNDTFSANIGGPTVNVDLGAGFDTANIDHSGEATNEYGGFYALGYYSSGYSYINLRGSTDTVDIYNAEALNLKLGTGDDNFTVYGQATHATLDGGAGNDTFTGDFSDAAAAISLVLNPNASTRINGTGTTIGHFEQVSVAGGAGNDTLTGGNGPDTFSAGGGNDSLSGGGGDDQLFSGIGANTINGGAGNDTWTGDYSASTTPLTFTQTAPGDFTLTGGTTLTSIEAVNLTTGAADDSFHFGAGTSVYVHDLGGYNSYVIDHSGDAQAESGSFADSDDYYIVNGPDYVRSDYASALDLKLGSGNDTYYVSNIYGYFSIKVDLGSGDDYATSGGGEVTLYGGAGDDTVRFYGNAADFSLTTTSGVTTVHDTRAGAPLGDATLTGVEHAQFDDQTVNIATDTPPLAHDDSGYTVAEDHTLTITAASVLANDSDVNGDTLTVTAVSSAYGAASLNAAGNIVFTPGANYNGTAYLTYTVNDGTPGGDASAQITVNVTPVNDAPVAANDGAYAVVTGDTLTVTAASGQGVLANDSDVDGDTLTAVLKTGPAHGALTLGADGGFVYTPTAGYVGADSFTYRDKDPSGAFSGVATVTLSVAADHLPVAVTDTGFTLAEDHTLHTTAAALLANDTDADSGDTLSVTGVSSPYGTVTLDGAGNIAFTPYANYNGALYFNYTIADGHAGGVATGEVDVAVTPVNDAPSAADDGPYGLVTGNVLTVAAAGGVLANDSDVDGDALTAVLKAGPAHGSLTLSANGGFVYTPSAGYVGADSFTYQAKDPSAALSAVATVTLSVAADAVPLANSDGPVTILEDHTLATTAAALLANDTDADAGDTLTVTGVSSPYGTVTLGPTGDIAFIPDANSNGNESFQYTISDGHPGGTATGTVYVAVTPVNDAPVAAADAYTTRNDTALTVDAAHGVLADDSDVDGDALTAMLKTGPEHGALTLNPNGGFTYTPTASYSGSDSFTYQAKDTAGALSAAATVNLTVAANTPPVAQGDSGFTTPEDHALTIFAASLLANDSDADGDTLQLTAVSVAPGPGDGGSAALNAGGDIVYTPAANYNGQFFLRYTISDGHGGSAFGFVSGTVTPVNDAPVAAADGPYAATAGTALVVSAANGVLANDTDVDGDSLTAVLQTGVTHGALTLNGNGGFSYTATAGYAGMDSFTYLAKDPSGAGSNVVTVALAVAASGPHVINGDANPNTLTGDDGGDQINGLGGDDTLTGGKGADTIDGGLGFDSLVGGDGDDTYYVDAGGDVVREGAGGGVDAVHTTASWTATPGSQIEKLVADGSGALYLTGNALPMEIDGNAAVNKLDDGGGQDTLAGGGGSDVYVVHNALTQVLEAPGAGYDAVQTDLSSYSLPANVESLTFIGTGNFSGFGNASANLIAGGAGDDYLDGVANTDGKGDRLVGGKGDDIYVVHSNLDFVVEAVGEGTDTVLTTANSAVAAPNIEALSFIGSGDFTGFANTTGVTLTGGAGNDHLYGGAGADRLVGLGGSDVLTGKGGADVFVLGGGGAGTGGGVDRVTDFHTGEDHVAFGQIVTKVLFATDTFNSATAGGGPGADYLFYDQATGRLYDEGASFAVSGGHAVGGTETLIATFDAHPSLSAGDFIL